MKIKAQEELLAAQTRQLAQIENQTSKVTAAVSSGQGLSQVERLILSTQLSLYEQRAASCWSSRRRPVSCWSWRARSNEDES